VVGVVRVTRYVAVGVCSLRYAALRICDAGWYHKLLEQAAMLYARQAW
jgi:hypothetical protein